jgi:ABC-2 type transport system permease protein
MNNLRIFGLGGIHSYRALFSWQTPSFYLTTMLGYPLFLLLFFTYLGRYAVHESDAYFVVGNAVLGAAMGGLFGAAMTVGGERFTMTLAPLMATPANRAFLFLGRGLPNALNGILVSTWGFLMGWLLLDFDPPASALPKLAIIVVASAVSCTAFGLFVGATALHLRDASLVANPIHKLMLLVCGVNVSLAQLPAWLQTVGQAMPMTHGIAAAREVVGGQQLSTAIPAGSATSLLLDELIVGGAYAVGAVALLLLSERVARRNGSLDRI